MLTFIESLTAQVNVWILRYTVDELTLLIPQEHALQLGLKLLLFISLILIGKEILNAFITFGQKYYGEKLRIYVSKDLAQAIIDKILTYWLSFYVKR